jgi:opacity protein-like surface antigen
MSKQPMRLLCAALGAAALLASAPASADLVYLPGENTLFQGAGLGAVNTLLTLKSPGNSSSESGAVFAIGAGLGTSGDASRGASQSSLPTLGALGIGSASDLRLILNAVEPSGNSITVRQLTLSFYDALGVPLTSFMLGGPLTLDSTYTGIGQAGFVFGLDAAQSTVAGMAIDSSGTRWADVRVGLAASLTDATGGPESFFISAAPVATPVPEPGSAAMFAAGLALFGFLQHRRRR